MKNASKLKAGKCIKLFAGLLCVAAIAATALYMHYKMFHDITDVIPGHLYRSSEINPARLAKLVEEHGISLVIDVRHPYRDDTDAPQGTTQRKVKESREALRAAGIDHVSIPSIQRPNESMISAFLHATKDTDDKAILIHCDHGIGRAGVYTAIYLMEYEGVSNESARRVVSRYYSPRLHGRKHFRADFNKGKWILDYVPSWKRRAR